jgi:phospholipase/carboxylesterase
MNEDLETITVAGLTAKINRPTGVSIPPVTVMLHGWTGDENSMWVFARDLPANQQVIAPRAMYQSIHLQFGGYSWTNRHGGGWPTTSDFDPAVDRLAQMLHELSRKSTANFTKIGLVGFSQGAALAYAFLLRYPQRVKRIAALAGFMPVGSEEIDVSLKGLPVFIAHGSRDEIVPLDMAQKAEQFFVRSGADVTYCVSDIGHRMHADCYVGFKQFMA